MVNVVRWFCVSTATFTTVVDVKTWNFMENKDRCLKLEPCSWISCSFYFRILGFDKKPRAKGNSCMFFYRIFMKPIQRPQHMKHWSSGYHCALIYYESIFDNRSGENVYFW